MSLYVSFIYSMVTPNQTLLYSWNITLSDLPGGHRQQNDNQGLGISCITAKFERELVRNDRNNKFNRFLFGRIAKYIYIFFLKNSWHLSSTLMPYQMMKLQHCFQAPRHVMISAFTDKLWVIGHRQQRAPNLTILLGREWLFIDRF